MTGQQGSQGVRSYEDLVVWQKAFDLAEAMYMASSSFPKEEVYGLTSQIRRSAVSIPSNIAEGHERNSRGEFLQFLGHARGSLAELETQIKLAARLSYLSPEKYESLRNSMSEVGRLLNGLRTSLASPRSASS
jgi:four helix bundle protein